MELDWELAGLTDLDGRLRPVTLRVSGILVPPAVEVREDFLYYPLPEEWRSRLEDPAQREESLVQLVLRLENLGWKRREDTAGLLEEFLKLREGLPKVFARFAERWGPLWYAGRESGAAKFEAWSRLTDFPFEGVSAWQELVAKVHAALNIAACLLQEKPAPPEAWAELDYPGENSLAGQRQAFRRFLTEQLCPHFGGPHLVVGEDSSGFSLRLATGLGFYWPLWLQVAQVVTQSPGVYVCDGCGVPYIRQGRKPARGRRNFCPDCGEKTGWLASKRLHHRGRKGGGESAG